MSRLRIFDHDAPQAPLLATADHTAIAAELARIGVAFEQWEAAQPVTPGDPPEAILAAYRAHPGSAQAALAIIPTAEGGLRAAEGIMQLLLAGGVPPQAAAWFCDLSALYVSAVAAEESVWTQRGKAAAAGGRPVTEEDVVAQVRQVFAALPPATYPALTTYAAEMTTGDGDDRFEFGLDVLLAGLVAVSGRA